MKSKKSSSPTASSKPKQSPAARKFAARVKAVRTVHEAFLNRKNPVDPTGTMCFRALQIPGGDRPPRPDRVALRLNPKTNPFFMERLGINAALNPGAFYWKGKVHVVVRTEGYDRKSFFAIAESPNGLDHFRFWDEPCDIPELKPETNLYDMRVTFHEDGWIYGVFCAEAKDPNAPAGDLSSAVAWLEWCGQGFQEMGAPAEPQNTASQQRNVVLHPSSCRASMPSTRDRWTVSSTLDPAAESAGRSVATSAPASPDRR